MLKNNCKNSNWGFFFVLPALIGTFIFIIIPIFCSFTLSFTEWDLLNEIKFVGLDNYKAVLTEPIFKDILINTIVYALSVTAFAVISSFTIYITGSLITEAIWHFSEKDTPKAAVGIPLRTSVTSEFNCSNKFSGCIYLLNMQLKKLIK